MKRIRIIFRPFVRKYPFGGEHIIIKRKFTLIFVFELLDIRKLLIEAKGMAEKELLFLLVCRVLPVQPYWLALASFNSVC